MYYLKASGYLLIPPQKLVSVDNKTTAASYAYLFTTILIRKLLYYSRLEYI
jgi:hypothetical protein